MSHEALLAQLSAWQKHTGDTALANLLARAASALSGLHAEKEMWRVRCAEETIAWADEATENRRLLASEPQGEPSDAQVQDALDAYHGVKAAPDWSGQRVEQMRAALCVAGTTHD